MVLLFLDLLALWNGTGESFDARHVAAVVGEVVVADIETRHRPDGGMDGAGVSEMYIQMACGLTGTWAGRRPQ